MLRRQAYLLLVSLMLLTNQSVKAQVTIGDDTPPMVVSVLELITNSEGSGEYGGLRLPQLSDVNISTLTQNINNRGLTNRAKGLIVFNTTTNCMEIWNGLEFKSLCGDVGQAIIEFNCSKLKVYPTNEQRL